MHSLNETYVLVTSEVNHYKPGQQSEEWNKKYVKCQEFKPLDPEAFNFDVSFPYTTFALAGLLNAAGQRESAAVEIDFWLNNNRITDGAMAVPAWFGVYQLRTKLLIRNLLTQAQRRRESYEITIESISEFERIFASTTIISAREWQSKCTSTRDAQRMVFGYLMLLNGAAYDKVVLGERIDQKTIEWAKKIIALDGRCYPEIVDLDEYMGYFYHTYGAVMLAHTAQMNKDHPDDHSDYMRSLREARNAFERALWYLEPFTTKEREAGINTASLGRKLGLSRATQENVALVRKDLEQTRNLIRQ